MAKTETLWGDFEEFEEVDPVEPNEDQVDPIEPTEEDPAKEEGTEPKEKTLEDKDPKVEEEPSIYDQIANSLEEDELLLLDDDKTYDESPDGFKEMIRDSVSKYRQKLEEEFKVKEEEIRNSYASANAPKIADLDPDDEVHATYMLEKYYLETGFTEDEAKEGIAKGENWIEDSGRGWRKVVASPKPIDVVELDEVKDLIEAGCIVVTVGGGGIPALVENGRRAAQTYHRAG